MVTSLAKTSPTTVTKRRRRMPNELCLTACPGHSLHNPLIFVLVWVTLVTAISHSVYCLNSSIGSSLKLEAKQNATEVAKLAHQRAQRRIRRFLNIEPQMVDHNQLPMLYIGEIQLNEYPECEVWLEPYRNQCQQQYELFLKSQIARRYRKYQQLVEKRKQTAMQEGKPFKPMKPFTYDRNSEYIKHASCCGMWQARSCVIEAIERDRNHALKDRICPRDLVQRFRQLPNDPTVRADVFDYCSEYGDGALICNHMTASAAHLVTTQHWYRLFCALSLAFVFARLNLSP